MSKYEYNVKKDNDKCEYCKEEKFYFTKQNNIISCIKCSKTRRFL